ncbi:hypothetical protein ABPG77_003314 [Micractinium sp. CCAP 211/92]
MASADDSVAVHWPDGAAPEDSPAPLLAPPAAGDAVRQQRASAAKAGALVSSWRDAEAAPFTAVVGSDLFVTARHRAVGEARRERERQRDESSGGIGGAAWQRRSAPAQHYGYSLDDEDEDSEEDAGARDDDSEEESGRRRGRGGGSSRRRAARPRPQEGVASARPKRQRHTRPIDPDMLDTDAALTAAFGEAPGWAAAGMGVVGAPRTRSRATPVASMPTALAADSAVPAGAAAAAAEQSPAALLPPLPAPAQASPDQDGAPAIPPLAPVQRHELPTAAPAAPAATAAAAQAKPQPAVSEFSAASPPRLAGPPALGGLPLPTMQASAVPAAAEAALPTPMPLPPLPAAASAGGSTTGSCPFLPAALAVPLPVASSVPGLAAPLLPLAGAQGSVGASLALPAMPTGFAGAAAFQAAQQAAAVRSKVAATAGEQPQVAAQAEKAAASPAQPLLAARTAALFPAQVAALQVAGVALRAAPARVEHAAVKAEPLSAPPTAQQASALPASAAAAPATTTLPPLRTAGVAGAAALHGPVWPAVAPTVGPPAGNGSGRAPVDVLYGCAKCRYLRGGCNTCRAREPAFTRPRMRWKPDQGHYQIGVEAAPVFRPTPEEFKDPIAYISKIKPQAEKYGLAHIVPPPGWDPPFALERGTNGLSMESFRFAVRKQYTSHLCCRAGAAPPAPGTPPQERGPAPGGGEGPWSGRMGGTMRGGGERAVGMAGAAGAAPQQPAPPQPGQQHQQLPALHGDHQGQQGPRPMRQGSTGDAASPRSPAAASDGGSPREAPAVHEFGFPHLEKKHTLRSFAAYADWVKEIHFSDPLPATPIARSAGVSARSARCLQRRPRALPNSSMLPEPTIEQIEAEFWRIVESPDERVESLYGQDVDSGHHGSGFPLPLWRRRLLEQHLERQAAAAGAGGAPVELPGYADELERQYAEHPWNINNLPRCTESVLRYLPGADGELITGVMVPWLYVGSVLSAFCWHVEDHALCSINYHHMGSPKVWYGVPASATAALEEAVRDALPHLCAGNPRLMYQLVTALSPMELKKRGVPVYRVVHEPGSFVVTMPDAYHSGFNCGFNVAEAVNFAPSNWIPYGTDVAEKYRATGKPLTLSHDALLVTLVKAAEHKPAGQPSADGTDSSSAIEPALGGAGGDPQLPSAQHQQQLQFGSAAAWAAAAPGLPLPWEQPPPPRSRSRAGAAAGQAQLLSPLGPAPLQRAPLEGIALAAGELALRAAEERRRRMVAFVAVGKLPERRMAADAPPGSKDAQGMHANTADCDCSQCAGDLWLSAVVSPAAPGVAVCPEHAEALVRRHGCPPGSLVLLYRHSPQELDDMVALAAERIPGAAEAIAAARQRRGRIEAARVRARPVGPMYQVLASGQPVGALPIPVDGEDCCDSGEDDRSDEDWETAGEGSRTGGSSGRGGAKRRRSSGAKRQRAPHAAGVGMRMGMGMAGGGGRMGGVKRARMGGAASLPPPVVPAPGPADVAASMSAATASGGQPVQPAAALVPSEVAANTTAAVPPASVNVPLAHAEPPWQQRAADRLPPASMREAVPATQQQVQQQLEQRTEAAAAVLPAAGQAERHSGGTAPADAEQQQQQQQQHLAAAPESGGPQLLAAPNHPAAAAPMP